MNCELGSPIPSHWCDYDEHSVVRSVAPSFFLAIALSLCFASVLSALSIKAARRLCIGEDASLETIASSSGGSPCLVQWSRLTVAGGRVLYRARYSAQSKTFPNGCLVSEVLFEGDKQSVMPVWVEQEEDQMYRMDAVLVHRIGGVHVVEIGGCLNGTGGCGQLFLLWKPHHPMTPISPDLRGTFDARLPRGHSTLKSPFADLDHMTIKGQGWKQSDANCCPSLRMQCRLRFNGTFFSLAHCKTSRPAGQYRRKDRSGWYNQ